MNPFSSALQLLTATVGWRKTLKKTTARAGPELARGRSRILRGSLATTGA
jgi:hypothetical protein